MTMDIPPPRRSLAEVHAILSQPGMMHETHIETVHGIAVRVYKNLWPTLRAFWEASAQFGPRPYLVYANETSITYEEAHRQVRRMAHALRVNYGIRKGDRVALIMRNYPEWVIAFWAIHSLGAIAVAVNAWIDPKTLKYCLEDSGSLIAIVDQERLEVLKPIMQDLLSGVGYEVSETVKRHPLFPMVSGSRAEGLKGVIAVRCQAFCDRELEAVRSWDSLMQEFSGKWVDTPVPNVKILPDDDATIFYTSGTTGMPKGVLATNRSFLSNVPNVIVGGMRATLRRGEELVVPNPNDPQKGVLISVPLFHATGCHSMLGLATSAGAKVAFIYKWDVDAAADIILREKLTSCGGVPMMARQLVNHPKLKQAGDIIESFSYGGAPSPLELPGEARRAFPTSLPSQGYGMTETNSTAVCHAGEDYLRRPDSTGLATPVNDIVIMDEASKCEMPVGQEGEVWLKGANIAKGYWNKPEATAQAFTKDGWVKTGDVGCVDEEGFLYIRDRAKDMIIRGGENIASVTVENAIYKDHRVLDCAVVPIPHPTLGEQVAAVVATRPEHHGTLKADEVVAIAAKSLPKFAIPSYVVIIEEPIERNANGKVAKKDLKNWVHRRWKEENEKITAKL